jgi:uncharacterized protein YjbJ (UPF0337 family)
MSNTSRMISGAADYIKGKIQLMMGRATGSNSTKAKGIGNQVKGGVKYESGKAGKKIDDTLGK